VRVEADLPQGMAARIDAVGEDMDALVELLAPLPIKRENTWQELPDWQVMPVVVKRLVINTYLKEIIF